MISNFEACFAETMKWEGSAYVDNPHDPGGPTKWGVTITTLSQELGRRATELDVRNLTVGVALQIARKRYWNVIGGDTLPPGVDMEAFDICYNSGPGTALRWMRQTAMYSPTEQIRRLHALRMGFWHRLRIWVRFGRGWTNREKDVFAHALALDARGSKP